ncbi:MAG: hypothetical protein JO308_11055 [Verrucomicrobia bacterium]|nr:hypothetical protein [Verrucomicrobiota bacterium]
MQSKNQTHRANMQPEINTARAYKQVRNGERTFAAWTHPASNCRTYADVPVT